MIQRRVIGRPASSTGHLWRDGNRPGCPGCVSKKKGAMGDGDVGKGAGSEKVVMNVPTEMSFVPTCILKQSEMMRQV